MGKSNLINFRVNSANSQIQEMQCCNTTELTKPIPFQFTFYNVKEELGKTTEGQKPKLGEVFHARSGQKKHPTIQSMALFIFVFMLFWIFYKPLQLHVHKQLYSTLLKPNVRWLFKTIFSSSVLFLLILFILLSENCNGLDKERLHFQLEKCCLCAGALKKVKCCFHQFMIKNFILVTVGPEFLSFVWGVKNMSSGVYPALWLPC